MMVRTFVSIPITDTAPIGDVVSDVGSVRGVRVPPMRQVHMTLKFIGDVDERKLPRVVSAVKKACEGTQAFDLELKGLGCFPNRKHPSVVWIGAEPADILTHLADRIAEELSAVNVKFDDKPFKSHITIGRCRDKIDLNALLDKYRDTSFCTLRCDRVLVMKSVLSPSGAKHSVLETVLLG